MLYNLENKIQTAHCDSSLTTGQDTVENKIQTAHCDSSLTTGQDWSEVDDDGQMLIPAACPLPPAMVSGACELSSLSLTFLYARHAMEHTATVTASTSLNH
jgi:hypothetical protein